MGLHWLEPCNRSFLYRLSHHNRFRRIMPVTMITVAVAKTSYGYYKNVVQAYCVVRNAPTFETLLSSELT